MNIVTAILLLIGGLVVLWKAAGLLVDGAVALAERLGVSPLVIGLTVVAMGTSAPEVAASIAAAVRGAGDVAVGNVFGSNIANLALVGGVCALIRPIKIQLRTQVAEIPVMLGVGLLLWPVLRDLELARTEGFMLLAVFAGLMGVMVYLARREKQNGIQSEQEGQKQSVTKGMKKSAVFIAIGLVGLTVGADMTVRGAVFIGGAVGLSEAVIGLTIIAIGTSLPELLTCVAAAYKGHDDLSIGNLVGSNVFNTLLVTGTAGVIRPFAIVPRLAGKDFWAMIGVSFCFALLVFIGRRKITRAAGAVLVCIYVGYMVYLLSGM